VIAAPLGQALAREVLAAVRENGELREELRELVADLLPEQQPWQSPWLDYERAAEYLGVSPRTVKRLVAQGRLRAATVGRRRLIHRDDLEALLSGGGEGATAKPLRSAARR